MTKARGTAVAKPQGWKHLRKHMKYGTVGWKRLFWKRDRRSQATIIRAVSNQA